MFDDPNYTKPRAGSAVGQGLMALVNSYNQGRQLQNQTKETNWKNPYRPISDLDKLEALKSNPFFQLAQLQNMGNNGSGMDINNVIQGLTKILSGNNSQPTAPAGNSGVAAPSASSGNPGFLNPQQLAAQNQAAAQPQVNTPTPVIKIGRFNVSKNP